MYRSVPARAVAATAALLSLAACGPRLTARSASARSGINTTQACAAFRDTIPSDGAQIYLDGEVDRAVALYRQKPPAPPPRVDGNVLVRFVVAPDGRVDWESFAVLRSTDPALARYAEQLVGATIYEPAMLRGQPVRQCIVVPMVFTADR